MRSKIKRVYNFVSELFYFKYILNAEGARGVSYLKILKE